MPKPLRELTPSEARNEISKAQPKEAPANQLFYDGDHWQGGAGYIGPRPKVGEQGAEIVLSLIQGGFVSRNAVAETSNRHGNALVGREPKWGYAVRRALEEDEEPTPEETSTINELEAAVTEWWNQRQLAELLINLAVMPLHQKRSLARFFVPRGRLNSTTENVDGKEVTRYKTPEVTELPRALDFIYIDSPHPSVALVENDPVSMEPVSFHVATEENGGDYVDVTFVKRNPDGTLGATVVRRTGPQGSADVEYELGGRLLMGQVERPLLITTQVQQQQRALNLAETLIPRNVITGGFLERIILNAQMPGKYVDDDTISGGKRFIPSPYLTGPSTTNFLKGIEVEDLDGKSRITTPSVTFRDPIPPDASIAASEAHYKAILHEVDQLHHLITDKATASAVSRVEARVDFLHSLRRTQAAIERLGRWLLETVLALAEVMLGKPGQYTKLYRAEFNCRIQMGHLTPEEQQALKEMYEAGLVTREDAMALLGVDDVDIAIAKINAQPGAMLGLREKQATVLALLQDAGIELVLAAELAGFSEDEITKLKAMPPVEDPAEEDEEDPGGSE